MTKYAPDNWVVLKISPKNKAPHYRVLGGWSGGYLYGDSWRMNSGIVSVEETEDEWVFFGASGSQYVCWKSAYTVRMNIAGVIRTYEELYPGLIEVMPDDTDWKKLFPAP